MQSLKKLHYIEQTQVSAYKVSFKPPSLRDIPFYASVHTDKRTYVAQCMHCPQAYNTKLEY